MPLNNDNFYGGNPDLQVQSPNFYVINEFKFINALQGNVEWAEQNTSRMKLLVGGSSLPL